jgi:hypothetical protein
MDLALRPRSATEIVDGAFRLVRRHPGPFLTLAVVAAVPGLAIGLAQLGLTFGSGLAAATTPGAITPVAMLSAPYLLLSLASIVVLAAFEAAFVALTDDALRDDAPTAGRALARGAARALSAVAVFLAVVVVSAIGFVFLVVPGVYLFVRLYPALPTAVVEGVGPVEALGRAWRRTRGSVGRGVVVYVVLFFLLLLALVAGGMLGGLLGGAVGLVTGGAARGALIAGVLAQQAVSILVRPLMAAATTLFYFDTRVRSDGLDVEMMAEALGGLGTAGAAPLPGR